jgi:hypothetical protein
MSINESERFIMLVGLRKGLGDEVADILMQHLPPSGWSDVARQSDINRLESRMDRLESRMDRLELSFYRLEERVGKVENQLIKVEAAVESLQGSVKQLDSRVDSVVYGLWALGGLMATGFFGLFAVIITKF